MKQITTLTEYLQASAGKQKRFIESVLVYKIAALVGGTFAAMNDDTPQGIPNVAYAITRIMGTNNGYSNIHFYDTSSGLVIKIFNFETKQLEDIKPE